MGNPSHDIRICRLHELSIRGEDGRSHQLHYGQAVEMTPAIIEAVGRYIDQFEPVPPAGLALAQADQAEE